MRTTRDRSTVCGSTSSTLTIVDGRCPGSSGSSGGPSSASRSALRRASPSIDPGIVSTARSPTSDSPERGKRGLSSSIRVVPNASTSSPSRRVQRVRAAVRRGRRCSRRRRSPPSRRRARRARGRRARRRSPPRGRARGPASTSAPAGTWIRLTPTVDRPGLVSRDTSSAPCRWPTSACSRSASSKCVMPTPRTLRPARRSERAGERRSTRRAAGPADRCV